MKDIKKRALVSEEVNHQDIGGKEIIIEKEGTADILLDKPIGEMTPAEINFIKRRTDLFLNNTDEECSEIKIYYGHIGILGYIVCEDEIKEMK